MFKTIIATCLLTFSCSSGSLKNIDTPKNLVSQNELYGNYCLKQVYNFDFDSNFIGDIVLDDTFDCYVPFYFGTETGTTYLNKIGVYLTNNFATFTFYYYYEETTELETVVFPTTFTGTDLSDVNFNYKDLHFYLPQRLTVSTLNFNVFNNLFTREANEYVTYYTGYYTYVRSNELTSYFGATGGFIFNNAMYYNMNRYVNDTSQNLLRFQYLKDFETLNEPFVMSTTTLTPMSTSVISQIYMTSVMMSTRSYDVLSNVGVFEYVPDVNRSSWYEMILSVMDAPIYYLKNLLGFELFGIELFVALASLLTLVLVLVVVKKVI